MGRWRTSPRLAGKAVSNVVPWFTSSDRADTDLLLGRGLARHRGECQGRGRASTFLIISRAPSFDPKGGAAPRAETIQAAHHGGRKTRVIQMSRASGSSR